MLPLVNQAKTGLAAEALCFYHLFKYVCGNATLQQLTDTKLTFHTQLTQTGFTEMRHVSDRQPARRYDRAPPSSPCIFLDGPSSCRVL